MILLVVEKRVSVQRILLGTIGHSITMKGSIHQDDTNIINIYVPNNRISKYMDF